MAFHYTFIPVGALFHSAPRLERALEKETIVLSARM